MGSFAFHLGNQRSIERFDNGGTRPAIRHKGRVYTGGWTHNEVVDKLPKTVRETLHDHNSRGVEGSFEFGHVNKRGDFSTVDREPF